MSTEVGRKRLSLSEALIDNHLIMLLWNKETESQDETKTLLRKTVHLKTSNVHTNVIRSRVCAYLWPYYRDLLINDWDQEPSLLFALHSPIQKWLCVHLWPSGHQH
jgi:hypothetical protein